MGSSKRYTIKDMQKIARQYNGKCLSKKYINIRTPLLWYCYECGRKTWRTLQGVLAVKHICQPRSLEHQRIFLKIQTFAAAHHGECLSHEYLGSKVPLQWHCFRCDRYFTARLRNVVRVGLCHCLNREGLIEHRAKQMRKYTIDDIKKLAKRYHAECLSTNYINMNTPLLWRCELCQRETWRSLQGVLQCGHACGNSEHLRKYTIDHMRKIAITKNGKCLSEEYKRTDAPLLWYCNTCQQTWQTRADQILSGGWCPYCKYKCERECRRVLETFFSLSFSKTRKCLDGRLELDGYCEKLHLAFEYNGKQHYSPVAFLKVDERRLKIQQACDARKAQLCRELGITLIVIPYTVKYNHLETFIRSELQRLGVALPDQAPLAITGT